MERKTNIMKFVLNGFPESYIAETIDGIRNIPGTAKCYLNCKNEDQEYDILVVERYNHFDFYNGTAVKLDYDPTITAEELPQYICDAVDEMV